MAGIPLIDRVKILTSIINNNQNNWYTSKAYKEFKSTHHEYLIDFDALSNDYLERHDWLGKSKNDSYIINKFFKVLDSISFPINMKAELVNNIQKDLFPISLFVLLQCVDKESFFIDVTQNFLPKQGTIMYKKMGVALFKATINSIAKNWKMFKLLFTTLTVDRALRVDVLCYLMSTPTHLTALRNSISKTSNFSTAIYVIMFVGLIFPQRQFTNGQQFVAKLWINKNDEDVPSCYYENFPFDCSQGSLSVLEYFETIRSSDWIESFDDLYEIKSLIAMDHADITSDFKSRRIFIQLEADNVLIWFFENNSDTFMVTKQSHIKFLEPIEIEMKVINQLDVVENKSLCEITGKFETDMTITKLERLFLVENDHNFESIKKNSTFKIILILKNAGRLNSFLKVFQAFESRDINENGRCLPNSDKEHSYEDSYVYTLESPIILYNEKQFVLDPVAENPVSNRSILYVSNADKQQLSKDHVEKSASNEIISPNSESTIIIAADNPNMPSVLATPQPREEVASSSDTNTTVISTSTTTSNNANTTLLGDSTLSKRPNKFHKLVKEKFQDSKLKNKSVQNGVWDIASSQKKQNRDLIESKTKDSNTSRSFDKNRNGSNILSKLRNVAIYQGNNYNNSLVSKSKDTSGITDNDTSMSKLVNESTTTSEVVSSPLEKVARRKEITRKHALLEDNVEGSEFDNSIAKRVTRKRIVYSKQEKLTKVSKEKVIGQENINADCSTDKITKKSKCQKINEGIAMVPVSQLDDNPIVKRLRTREKHKDEEVAADLMSKKPKFTKSKKETYRQCRKTPNSKCESNSEVIAINGTPTTNSNNNVSSVPIYNRSTTNKSTNISSSQSVFNNTDINGVIMNPLNAQYQIFQSMSLLSQTLVNKMSIMNVEMQRKADEITKHMKVQMDDIRKEHEKKLQEFHSFVHQMSNAALQDNKNLEDWINKNK